MRPTADSVWETDTARQFATVIAVMNDTDTIRNFLRDVMTEKEIIDISTRLEAARMLKAGKKYTEVIERTRLSSRTIARISDWIQNGQNGYAEAFRILDAHHGHIPPARAK